MSKHIILGGRAKGSQVLGQIPIHSKMKTRDDLFLLFRDRMVVQKGFTEGDTWHHEACPDSPSRKCSLCLLQLMHFIQVLGAQAPARPCLSQPPLPPSSPLLPPPSLCTQLSQLTLIPPEGFGQLHTCSPSGWINREVQSLRFLRMPVCRRAPALLEHRQSTTGSSLPDVLWA